MRFGWKAQNKSLEMFAGEAYNVEIGVTNELFPNERDDPPGNCLMNPTPEDAQLLPDRRSNSQRHRGVFELHALPCASNDAGLQPSIKRRYL